MSIVEQIIIVEWPETLYYAKLHPPKRAIIELVQTSQSPRTLTMTLPVWPTADACEFYIQSYAAGSGSATPITKDEAIDLAKEIAKTITVRAVSLIEGGQVKDLFWIS